MRSDEILHKSNAALPCTDRQLTQDFELLIAYMLQSSTTKVYPTMWVARVSVVLLEDTYVIGANDDRVPMSGEIA